MKKGLTLLLAVVMAFTMATANVSAASFADTDGKSCETAVEVLSALGIVEGKAEGSYEPDSSLTRAEMATIILRAMNMSAGAAGSDIFTDVPASHWAYANVAAAYQLGIINGTSATTFAPDAVVTYEQAVKMVVAALGYTVEAEAMGGYPSGYLAKAAHLDILKGVKTGGEMSRGDMAILLYNALDTEPLVKTSYGEDAWEFEADETKTLLSYYLKVTKVTGEVTATPMAQTAAPARRLLSDEVAVGSDIMKVGETDAQNMLGIRSEVYTRTEDNSDYPVILAIVPRSNVKVLNLKGQDIENVENGRITYVDAEGKDEEVSVSGAKMVYNGREKTMTDELLMPEIGTLRLISNSGSDYDLVIVEKYTNHVVQTVSVEDCLVTFKDNSQLTIDFDDKSVAVVMTDAAGAPVELESLAEWDVLSVAESDDKAVRRIYRSTERVEGAVSEVSGEEVTIGENVYPMNKTLLVGEIKLGQAAAYYLDFTGAVAAVDKNYDTSRIYGWLKNAQTTAGIGGKPQLKIFTQDGEWKVFDVADRVKLNGKSIGSEDLLKNGTAAENMWQEGTAPTLVDASGVAVPQLLAYKVNEAGVLTEIETAANRSNPNIDDADKIGGDFSMDFYTHGSKSGVGQKTGTFDNSKTGDVTTTGKFVADYTEKVGNVFFGKVFTSADTKYFNIPADLNDEKNYFMGNVAKETLDTFRLLKCVTFYDINEDFFCGAMVLRNDLSQDTTIKYPNYEVPVALVTGISTVLTEDGDTKMAVKLFTQAGQEISATVDADFQVYYKSANADFKNDDAWYTHKSENGVTTCDPAMVKLIETSDNNRATGIDMFIDIQDLEPGDVIQYELGPSGDLSKANLAFRNNHAYPGGAEFSVNEGKITTTSAIRNYVGGALQVHGEVTKLFSSGFQAKINLTNKNGTPNGATALRSMPKSGKFYLWDRDKQTVRAITAADVIVGDEVFAFYETVKQNMVVVYR